MKSTESEMVLRLARCEILTAHHADHEAPRVVDARAIVRGVRHSGGLRGAGSA